jgi:hypothetical protein
MTRRFSNASRQSGLCAGEHCPILRRELLVDLMHLRLRGVLGQIQLAPDLAVRQIRANEAHDVTFALGQSVEKIHESHGGNTQLIATIYCPAEAASSLFIGTNHFFAHNHRGEFRADSYINYEP